jgi:hypothetical protein
VGRIGFSAQLPRRTQRRVESREAKNLIASSRRDRLIVARHECLGVDVKRLRPGGAVEVIVSPKVSSIGLFGQIENLDPDRLVSRS